MDGAALRPDERAREPPLALPHASLLWHRCRFSLLRDDVPPADEHVDPRAGTSVRLDGAVHDRFAGEIEAGVEQDGDARPAPDLLEERVEARSHLPVDGLDARGAVDVGHGGEAGAHVGADGEDPAHESAEMLGGRRELEEPRGRLDGDRGREGTELLAELDAAVELVAHRRVRRSGEDAPVSQGAGTEFRAPLDPSDDAAVAKLVGGAADHLGVVAEAVDGQSVLARDARDVARLRSPEGMVGHGAMRALAVEPIHPERRAHRAARVPGRARDEDAGKSRLAQDARVRAAIQRDAAAEAESGEAGLCLEPAGQVDQRLLEDPLDGAGDVREAAAVGAAQVDRVPGVAGRPEHFDELARIGSRGGEVELEAVEVESERAVLGAAQDPADLVQVGGLAVRGEAHHLVFALVDGEAEERREGRVEHSQRMREADFAEEAQIRRAVVADFARAHREGRPLADAVGGEDGRFPRGSGEERGRRVRLVVLGEEDLPGRHAELRGDDSLDPQLLAEEVAHRLREAAGGTGEAAQGHGQHPLELQHRLLVEDDGVEILGIELRVLEAEIDGGERERGVVLAPGEALFLDGADGDAVDDEGRGGVVVVRRDAEDAHQYWLLASGSAREALKPFGSRRAARRARSTKGGRRTKYWSRRSSEPRTPASAAAMRR
jgi:hypothetical protein